MLTQSSHDAAVVDQTADHPVSDNLKALFYVVGDADPAFLPRLIEPVAKLGHVPSRVHASTEAGDGSVMTVDLRVPDVAQVLAERMENALRRVVGVHQVIAVYERG
ncbi:MAG: hypothetical protein ACR2PI_20910 [Hyphomicrobiaceae bacterium]